MNACSSECCCDKHQHRSCLISSGDKSVPGMLSAVVMRFCWVSTNEVLKENEEGRAQGLEGYFMSLLCLPSFQAAKLTGLKSDVPEVRRDRRAQRDLYRWHWLKQLHADMDLLPRTRMKTTGLKLLESLKFRPRHHFGPEQIIVIKPLLLMENKIASKTAKVLNISLICCFL